MGKRLVEGFDPLRIIRPHVEEEEEEEEEEAVEEDATIEGVDEGVDAATGSEEQDENVTSLANLVEVLTSEKLSQPADPSTV